LVLLAAVAAAVARIIGTAARTDRSGRELIPNIGGDTWAPVPVNRARQG
jgi:hypothetical protein